MNLVCLLGEPLVGDPEEVAEGPRPWVQRDHPKSDLVAYDDHRTLPLADGLECTLDRVSEDGPDVGFVVANDGAEPQRQAVEQDRHRWLD